MQLLKLLTFLFAQVIDHSVSHKRMTVARFKFKSVTFLLTFEFISFAVVYKKRINLI